MAIAIDDNLILPSFHTALTNRFIHLSHLPTPSEPIVCNSHTKLIPLLPEHEFVLSMSSTRLIRTPSKC